MQFKKIFEKNFKTISKKVFNNHKHKNIEGKIKNNTIRIELNMQIVLYFFIQDLIIL